MILQNNTSLWSSSIICLRIAPPRNNLQVKSWVTLKSVLLCWYAGLKPNHYYTTTYFKLSSCFSNAQRTAPISWRLLSSSTQSIKLSIG